MRFLLTMLCAACSISLAAPAAAMIGPALDPGMVTVTMGTNAVEQAETNRAMGANFMQGLRLVAPQKKVTPSSQQALTYKISLPRRQANYRSFVEKTYEMGKAAGDEVAAVLGKGGDPIRQVEGPLSANFGFRANNVADAYALWMAGAWKTVYDPDTDLTRSQFQAIRAQVANALATTSGMAEASDEVKQNMAESLIIHALLLDGAVNQSSGDPAMRKQLQAAVLRNAKAGMNIDLSAITLTDNGFVPRRGGKRGDAGEAIEGADPAAANERVAEASAPAPADGYSGRDVALLVAAVSAGAGGLFMIGKGISQRQG